MTFHDRYYRSPRPHLDLVLARLHRERSGAFGAVCDMVSIPRDLRRALLATLLAEGYVTDAGGGQVSLTPRGIASAVALHAEEVAIVRRRGQHHRPAAPGPGGG